MHLPCELVELELMKAARTPEVLTFCHFLTSGSYRVRSVFVHERLSLRNTNAERVCSCCVHTCVRFPYTAVIVLTEVDCRSRHLFLRSRLPSGISPSSS